MAGMLPGVEAARRRRFGSSEIMSTRRSSFCLYATHRATFHLYTSTSFQNTPNTTQRDVESKLGAEVREAKKRLDQRLTRSSKREENRPTSRASEVSKKSGAKRLRWLKLRWRSSSEQEECAVCLEQLKAAPPPLNLMQLACGHRFHRNCLLPWLVANAHCPCCRMEITSPNLC